MLRLLLAPFLSKSRVRTCPFLAAEQHRASSIASSQHDVCMLRSVSRSRLYKCCCCPQRGDHLPLLPSPTLLSAPGSGGVGDRSGGHGTWAESTLMAAIALSQSPQPGCAEHASENVSNAGQRAGGRCGIERSTLGRSGPGSPWVSAGAGPFLLLWCTTDGDVKLIGRRTCSRRIFGSRRRDLA